MEKVGIKAKKKIWGGAWVAQLVKRLPSNSGHGLRVLGSSPTSGSLLLFFFVFVFVLIHSDRCQVISHCGFDLHFPDN